MVVASRIILVCDGDTFVYSSPQAAERGIELVDVENGEYQKGWDEEGRRWSVEIEQRPRPTVRLVSASEYPLDLEGLGNSLVAWLISMGAPVAIPVDASVGQLLRIVELGQSARYATNKWAAALDEQ